MSQTNDRITRILQTAVLNAYRRAWHDVDPEDCAATNLATDILQLFDGAASGVAQVLTERPDMPLPSEWGTLKAALLRVIRDTAGPDKTDEFKALCLDLVMDVSIPILETELADG